MEFEMIRTRSIYPPHSAENEEKVLALYASMQRDGWQGRPLLVVPSGDAYQALTGSHRWKAADEAGIEEVPCVVVDAEKFYGAGYDINDLWDDDVRLSILREIGDEDAARLMAEEIATNA